MPIAFIASFLANLALGLISLVVLPDRVAIHFGSGGVANGWASNTANTFLMFGLDTLLFFSLYLSPQLVSKLPAKWVSLPNRDYWLSPENKTRAVETMSRFLWQFGTALFLFLFFAGLLTIRANLSDPVQLDERLFLSALAVFFVYTIYWIIVLIRAYRIPAQGRGSR